MSSHQVGRCRECRITRPLARGFCAGCRRALDRAENPSPATLAARSALNYWITHNLQSRRSTAA